MIKNIQKTITEYAEAQKSACEVYSQAVDYIKKNYVEGSPIYKSAMQTALSTLEEALTPIKDKCKAEARKEIEQAKKAVSGAVTVPQSPDLEGILPLIRDKKLSEMELETIVEKYSGNYMDSKLIHDAMGKSFKPLDQVIRSVDRLSQNVDAFFNSYNGQTEAHSYSENVLIGGAQIEMVSSMVDDFLTSYGNQDSDK